jgi:general stress protein YciG
VSVLVSPPIKERTMANNENRDTQQRRNKSWGNFANNPQKAAEAGSKGGEHS